MSMKTESFFIEFNEVCGRGYATFVLKNMYSKELTCIGVDLVTKEFGAIFMEPFANFTNFDYEEDKIFSYIRRVNSPYSEIDTYVYAISKNCTNPAIILKNNFKNFLAVYDELEKYKEDIFKYIERKIAEDLI